MRHVPLALATVLLAGPALGQWSPSVDARFKAMDKNGDGFASRGEWLGPPASFALFDLDRDGRVSAEEFQKGTVGVAKAAGQPLRDSVAGVPPSGPPRAATPLPTVLPVGGYPCRTPQTGDRVVATFAVTGPEAYSFAGRPGKLAYDAKTGIVTLLEGPVTGFGAKLVAATPGEPRIDLTPPAGNGPGQSDISCRKLPGASPAAAPAQTPAPASPSRPQGAKPR